MLIYVDDMLILSPNQSEINSLITSLNEKFSLYDLGPASYFLGIELQSHKDGFVLSQSKYTASILKRMNMETTKPTATPAPPLPISLSLMMFVQTMSFSIKVWLGLKVPIGWWFNLRGGGGELGLCINFNC